jgi:Spy/CpxP family protein refolding chaperone
MKIKLLLMISILALALQSNPAAFGQDTDQPGNGRHGGRWGQRMANLSPQDRQKLEAAQQKAMQDPAVQAASEKMKQARKEFRDAMRAAMLKADPSIQPILDKMPVHRRGSRGRAGTEQSSDQ